LASAWPQRSANKRASRKGDHAYPIAIEPKARPSASWFPICPECFSAGDTLDDAMTGAEEAVAAWIDAALDAGEAIPGPSGLDVMRANPNYVGWTFAIVTVDPGLLDDTTERVNITLPRAP
jgi:predicted RNase H-like HicB family nuclease